METDDIAMENVNAPNIGPILQMQRKERRLTLERLAALSGVSKSMLSQIERSQANPTFAVLWSLTRALQIEFSDLVGVGSTTTDGNTIELVTASHSPEIKSSDGTCRLRILSPPRLAGVTEWYDIEIAPAGTLDSSPHASGAVEHVTAYSPGLEITSGRSSRILDVGETARYPADVPHRITNLSSQSARGLMVVLYR